MWTASKTMAGYGHYTIGLRSKSNIKRVYTHRLAWAITYPNLPIGDLCVCHRCDNPPCCNPEHLFLGTHTDNMRDREAKNRSNPKPRLGWGHTNAKLTEDNVYDIRASKERHRVLAARFGISSAHISRIKSRKAWKHLEEEYSWD